MLPDPNVFESFARDAIYGIRCGWLHWRIARLERKKEKLGIKQMNLKIKEWAQ